ncbi:hypothetical protein Pme01_54810 [Planosporangium mesophilum]|uniref:Uncharacterized protein n=1 Tax=Planosporangium mesophilum TaxID=689768 RepID=A0A8J3TGK8_9ACTN|nr:hypothetical protein Pme01_54810 [Planosporangium mesophilum]
MRRTQVRWRLSAVLLVLLLAFVTAVCRPTGGGRTGPGDTSRSLSAVMLADAVSASSGAGMGDGQPRLTTSRDNGPVLLFMAVLSALLAALLSRVWPKTASSPWLLPAASWAAARGRAPPRLV